MKQNMVAEASGGDQENSQLIDYMLHNQQQEHQDHHHHQPYISLDDKLNFQDVMQFADFGPKLNQQEEAKNNVPPEDQTTTGGIDDDPIFFLKFPVLNDHHHQEHDHQQQHDGHLMFGSAREEDHEVRFVQGSDQNVEKNPLGHEVKINKKKRARSIKTSEEVESQRMTHIAVERNRRKQMNEHLRVLRSLMPGSYVQRGDQASIIGGAIEFVRELEQLLQCLESQKRRRLYGDNNNNVTTSSVVVPLADQNLQPSFFPAIIPPPNDVGGGLQPLQLHETEETAESKSCIADIEVKLLGFDAMIKILSRRRTGQLVKTIAALEDLQINILHTNITTIDQTVLYSFTVKVGGEARLTAEDIANSVQQIFTFIHAYDSI